MGFSPVRTEWWVGCLLAMLATVLFAIKAVVIKMAYATGLALNTPINATTLLMLRMLFSLPFFMLIAWFSRPQQGYKRSDISLIVAAGFVGYYLASILDFVGLQYISASLERMVLLLYPTITLLLLAVLGKQRLTLLNVGCALLSYVGVLLMVQGDMVLHPGKPIALGVALVFASAVCYAIYLLITPTLIQRLGSWHTIGTALTVSCVCAMAHYVLTIPTPIASAVQLPAQLLLFGLVLAVFATVIPVCAVVQGIARIGPSNTALISAISPLITLLLAWLLLGEQLTPLQWFGGLVNVSAITCMVLYGASKPRSAG